MVSWKKNNGSTKLDKTKDKKLDTLKNITWKMINYSKISIKKWWKNKGEKKN
jgi:hypothetical protein